MNYSKPFYIFRTLETKEREEFLELLQSSFFNKDKVLVSLFQFFSVTGNCDRRVWFSSCFPDKIYDDLSVRRYLSALNRLLEQYLILKELQEKENYQKELLLPALRKRILTKHYKARLTKTSSVSKSSLDLTSDFFLHQYRMSCEKEKFSLQLNQRKPKEDTEEGILQLDLFYIVEKLRNICELHNSKTIFEMEGQTYLNDEVILLARKEPFNNYPQVKIYSLLLETITQNNKDDAFYELQGLIREHSHLLSIYEEREIYLALVNYCIRKINQGNKESLAECFGLYKKMAEKNLLVSGKNISPWTYKNIITAALRLNELEWTFQFITNYKKQLAEEYRENAFNYNLAKYNFHLKKYHKVLDLLQKVAHDDIFYGLDSRTLLMKVYYNLNEEEALFSLTDSFRIYLKRKKRIPRERRKTYLNFIKFIRRLVTLSPRDYPKLKTLYSKIEDTNKVADKAWILEKVEIKYRMVEYLYKK